MRVIDQTERSVDIRGIDNHQVTNIPIATVGGVISTQRGEAIAIMHQYAYTGKGKTIHSSGQMEWFKNNVNDKSIKVDGGLQRILTLEGYHIPLNFIEGLPYCKIRPFTDREWDTLPHVILTGDKDWDPRVLDHSIEDDDKWYDAISDDIGLEVMDKFDEFGNYRNTVQVQGTMLSFFDTLQDESDDIDTAMDKCCIYHAMDTEIIQEGEVKIQSKEPEYELLRPFFGWLPTDIVKKTFAATTQYGRMPGSTYLKKHYKAPNPAFNVRRRDEPVATDTVYSNTPAIDSGATSAQIFVGKESLVTDVYGMKSDKQFVNTLQDNIRERGAMSGLLSDRAQVEIGKKTKDILRALCISDWQSEPHQQHQNPAERRYQVVKQMANTIMDRTGTPARAWLLCLMYVCFILNHTVADSINSVPLTRAYGSTKDISPLLRFRWWEPIYYKLDDSSFPSDTREGLGRYVGIAENVGHLMTFKILTDDTQKIIYRSSVRSALDSYAPNLRLDPLNDAPPEVSLLLMIQSPVPYTERRRNYWICLDGRVLNV